ncbi:MAG: hemolysin family protein [Elusimicrobiota bacterium]|jgi:putative hemolysin|nr:hemolysin family protein [Elusimicrobiota bacterium]
MFILIGFILMMFCLCGSAWISAAEISITSLSQLRVKKLIAQKPTLSEMLLAWLNTPYYLLTLILTINVIFDMFFSFFATFVLTNSFNMFNHHIMEFASWLLSSFLIIVFGELVPKLYAWSNYEKISIFSLRLMSRIEKVLKYILYPIIKLSELTLPKLAIKISPELSKEEAASMIDEGSVAGELDKDTSAMLNKTLNFPELSVKKIMQPIETAEMVDVNLGEEEFLDQVVETARSRLPIYKGSRDNVIGYIHIKDILIAWQAGRKNFAKSLIRPLYFVDETKQITDLLREFQCGKTHIAFVKNKDLKIVGFLTLEDILEEIVGEIVDEYELKK